MDILIPYLHHFGIMALMGSLITEHVLLKPNISRDQIKSLAVVNLIYGLAAVVVFISGLLRWFFVDPKGADYFNTNPMFHIKLTLFVVVFVLSLFPTRKFLKWRKQANQNAIPEINVNEIKKQLMFVRIELLLLAIIPLLAVLVASGKGF